MRTGRGAILLDRDLFVPDERFVELVEVGFRSLDKDPSIAADRDGPIPTGIHPPVLRQPVHVAHSRMGGRQGIEHHRHGCAELRSHRRHVLRHVHLGFIVHQFSIRTELSGGNDTIYLQEII